VSGQSALPTVSVVVPTFRRGPALAPVLDAVLAQDPHELVVVFDGSQDRAYDLVVDRARCDSRLVAIYQDNQGEMAARETGARRATGEVVLFVDDDVLAHPGLVAGHARLQRDHVRRVVVGYMPVRLATNRGRSDVATGLYAQEYESHCTLCERDPDRVLVHLWAGNLSMRRGEALAVGLNSPHYHERYHPDRDLGLRIRREGFEAVFSRELRADHLHSRSLAAFVRDARSQGAGRARLHELHADQLGPMLEDELITGLPGPARRLAAAAEHPAAHLALSCTLLVLVRILAILRLTRPQVLAVRLLRRIEQVHGAAQARGGT